jgi:hypothetical protein
VLDAWAKDVVSLQDYVAGSDGPADRREG